VDKNGFRKKTHFTIIKSFQQDWVGGVPGTSGTNIQVIVNNSTAKVKPLAIYFKKKKENIAVKSSDEGVVWIANFLNNKKKEVKKDLIMSDDTYAEYGNKAPKIEKLPFTINKDDIILSYSLKGKVYYFKLENVEKKETLFLPSAQPKN
jgi:hypothetical protein